MKPWLHALAFAFGVSSVAAAADTMIPTSPVELGVVGVVLLIAYRALDLAINAVKSRVMPAPEPVVQQSAIDSIKLQLSQIEKIVCAEYEDGTKKVWNSPTLLAAISENTAATKAMTAMIGDYISETKKRDARGG